ncbi:MAG: peptide deformylase [Nitrospiraceae bacterium]|nr:peptide deformylase [Nitrospiraceae bacterium]
MALIRIITYPDEVLRKKTAPVKNIDGSLQRLIDDMIETMYAAPGVGLAAPQVGVSKRLAVIDVNVREGQTEKLPLYVLINPEIVSAEGEVESEEGCLSLPGLTAEAARAERVFVKALGRDGKPFEIDATGLLAIALQHEIDHLEGTLLLDRISPLKRSFYKKRALKKSLAR